MRAAAEKLDREIYIVGGYVRDALLGVETQDIDLASAASTAEVKAVFGESATVVNKNLGTVHIVQDGICMEHTTFRTDRYGSGGGHTPEAVMLGVSMEEDACRRDFTVNALYCSVRTGQVFDPTGRGLADLFARRLQTTTKNPDEILQNDGLRILRMVRLFAERGLTPTKALMQSAKKHCALLRDIAPERIMAELLRILSAEKGSGIKLLRACGALVVIFPELAEGKNFRQIGKKHKYSLLTHNVNAAALLPPKPELRMAGLLHDVGKPLCKRERGNLWQHEVYSAMLARKMLGRLRFSKRFTQDTVYLIEHHMFYKENMTDEKIKRHILALGEAHIEDFIVLHKADVLGSGRTEGIFEETARYKRILGELRESHAPFSIKDLAVTGNDLQKLGLCGPEIGKTLQKLLEESFLKPEINRKEILLQYAEKMREAID